MAIIFLNIFLFLFFFYFAWSDLRLDLILPRLVLNPWTQLILWSLPPKFLGLQMYT